MGKVGLGIQEWGFRREGRDTCVRSEGHWTTWEGVGGGLPSDKETSIVEDGVAAYAIQPSGFILILHPPTTKGSGWAPHAGF